MKRFNELKAEMKKHLMMMLHEESQELEKLELIDNLQRLGVSYHFKDEIIQILRSIHDQSSSEATSANSLYYTALKFRILRQHGFYISQGVLLPVSNYQTNFMNLLTFGHFYIYICLKHKRFFFSRYIKRFQG